MSKQIILVAGLPASGKDTVAKIFSEQNYKLITYSNDILKPIINNTEEQLTYFIQNTIDKKVNLNDLKLFVNEIEEIKSTQKGRNLYISIAQYLNRLVSQLTRNQYNHFSLFITCLIEKESNVVVSGFRQKPELDILKKRFSNTKVKTIFVDCDDNLRYKRMMKRDSLDMNTIFRNEIYEIETTYNKMLTEVKFDFTILNDSTLDVLCKKTEKVMLKL